MPPTNESVRRSVQVMVEAWRLMVGRLPEGRVEPFDGGTAAWGNDPLPFFNICFVAEGTDDLAEVGRRLEAARAFAAPAGLAWFAAVCAEWMPEGWRTAAEGVGLYPAESLTGMVTESLAPPRRPMPDLALRRVTDDASRRSVASLNDLAYGMPSGTCDCIGAATLWGDDLVGVVGAADGEDVSTAVVLPVDGDRYVAMVATHPDHGRRGYAECVMRRALDEAGPSMGSVRTSLHATDAGRPVYAAMGYEEAAHLVLLSEEPHG